MEPLTLGALAVALASKAAEKGGEKAVEGVIAAGRAMVGRLRRLFGDKDDTTADAMLTEIEGGNGNKTLLELLAGAVDKNLNEGDSDELALELRAILGDAEQAGYEQPGSWSQVVNITVTGDNNTTFSDVKDSDITVQK